MKSSLLQLTSFRFTFFATLLMIFSGIILLPALSYSQEKVAERVAELKSRNVFRKEYKPFSVTTEGEKEIAKTVTNATLLTANESRSEILVAKPEYLRMSIPVDHGTRQFHISLYKVSISPNDLNLITSDGKTDAATDMVHYRGIIDNDAHSIVSISISAGEMMGSISNDEGNYVLGRLDKNSAGTHIIYNDKNFLLRPASECGTNTETGAEGNRLAPAGIASTMTSTTNKCVNWYWETDYDLFVSKGSAANVNTYIQGIFNQVSTLYANEGITINLKTLYIWTSVDPYTGPNTSAYLTQFGDNRTSFDGDLAHLIGFAGSGGIAWINGLCSLPRYEMAYSGISSSYNTVPTYSWTVEVMTHEEGHLLGSRHTHDCVWNNNNTRIDSCGDAAGYSSCGGLAAPYTLPVGGGTIMSYCHLTGVGINFAKGMGPQPRAVMINNINLASCVTTCSTCPTPATPGTISGNTNICQNTTQTYSVAAVSGATSYTWTFPSGWTGTSTTNSISVTTNGASGNVTVKANNSCGSSPVQTKAVAVSAFPSQAGPIIGSTVVCPNSSKTYSVNAIASATGYTWSMPAGWIGTSTTNSIDLITGTNSGSITVRATNACGTGPVQSLPVSSVTAAPVQPGNISGNASVCQNSTQTYTINAVNGADSYTWILPLGWSGISNLNTITVTTGSTGGILGVVANNGCGSSLVRSIITTVNTLPGTPAAVTASGGPTGVCPGETRTYTTPLVSGMNYEWIAPLNTTITSGQGTNTIELMFNAGLASSVSLSVKAVNNCGMSGARTFTITRNVPGTPTGMTITGGVPKVCPGDARTYTVTALPNITYNWTVPVGATINSGQGTNAVNVSFDEDFTSSGTIRVSANNGCGTSNSYNLTVSRNVPSAPGTPIMTGGIPKVCPGDSRSYHVNGIEGLSYTWTTPAGANIVYGQGTDSIVVTFDDNFSSTGTLRVGATNSCGTGTTSNLTISRNVPASPGTPVVSGGTPKVCPGDSRTYSVTQLGELDYNWTVPVGATINSGQGTNSIVVTYDNSFTSGYVKASAVNNCGAGAASSLSVSRNTPATPGTISITGGGAKVCPGDSRTYSVANSAGVTYNWTAPTGGNITSGQGTNSVNISFDNNFTVNGILGVTANNSCGASSPRTLTIAKNTPATPGSITGPTQVCNNGAYIYSISAVTGANSYEWTLPAGASIIGINNGTSISVLWGTTAGAVSVKSINTCGVSSARSTNVVIYCPAGLEGNPHMILPPTAYPNPTDGNVIVRFQAPTESMYEISITDISGRVVKTENIKAKVGMNYRTYDLSALSQGMYLVRLKSNDNIGLLKVIVE